MALIENIVYFIFIFNRKYQQKIVYILKSTQKGDLIIDNYVVIQHSGISINTLNTDYF